MEGLNLDAGIHSATGWRRLRGITTRNRRCRSEQRRNSAGWIKLRQTIELLIRNAVIRPILPHVPKIMIEGSVLLREQNNVIDVVLQ